MTDEGDTAVSRLRPGQASRPKTREALIYAQHVNRQPGALWPETTHQVGGIKTDRRGDPNNVEQGDVHLATLYVADVGEVQPRQLRKALLGDGTPVGADERLPCGPNSATELHCLASSLLR